MTQKEHNDVQPHRELTSRETVVRILSDAMLKLLMEQQDGKKRRSRYGIPSRPRLP